MTKIILSAILLLILPIQAWTETLNWKDLVMRNGIYYKKFMDIPFSGNTQGVVDAKIKNGKFEGVVREYLENGQLRSKVLYKNGKKNGIWEKYWEGGKLMEKGSYINGKKDGAWMNFHTDGSLFQITSYKNDQLLNYTFFNIVE